MSDRKTENKPVNQENIPDAALSRLYKVAATAEPPSALDNAILAAARAEISSASHRAQRPWWQLWAVPFTAFATVVLTVSVTLNVNDEKEAREQAKLRQEMAQAAPQEWPQALPADGPSIVGSSTDDPNMGRTSADVSQQAPSAPTLNELSQPRKQHQKLISASRQSGTAVAKIAEESQKPQRALSAAPITNSPLTHAEPERHAFEKSVSADKAKQTKLQDHATSSAEVAARVVSPPEPASAPTPAPATSSNSGYLQNESASPSTSGANVYSERKAMKTPAASVADSGVVRRMARNSESDVNARSKPADVALKKESALSSSLTEQSDTPRSIEEWLKDLRLLKKQEKTKEFQEALVAFKRAYPNFKLPEDLR